MIQRSDVIRDALMEIVEWCDDCEVENGGPGDVLLPDDVAPHITSIVDMVLKERSDINS